MSHDSSRNGSSGTASSKRTDRAIDARNTNDIVREVALEQHRVEEAGTIIWRTTFEVVFQQLRRIAFEGSNAPALDELRRLYAETDPPDPDSGHGIMIAPAELSEEQLKEKMMKRNEMMEKYDVLSIMEAVVVCKAERTEAERERLRRERDGD